MPAFAWIVMLRRTVAQRHVRLICALALGVAAAACEAAGSEEPIRPLIRLTTGHPGGFFNPLGTALLTSLSAAMPDVDFQVVPSGGALENLELMQHGTADLGLTFSDIAYLAYSGRLEKQTAPFGELRGLAVLQLTAVHVVVRKGSGISSIRQLAGRKVALGPRGSGTAITAEVLLTAFDVPMTAVNGTFLPFLEASNGLIRGDLDAMFISAGYPAESVIAATDGGAHVLDISGPDVERLRIDYPFLRATVIPLGTYQSVKRPVHTVGIDAAIVCAATLDEDLVYRTTKNIFNALPDLVHEFEALRRLDIARAPATPVPLHPGAARYYRERELSR